MQITIDSDNIKIEKGMATIDLNAKQRAKIISSILFNKDYSRFGILELLVELSTLKPKDEFKIGDEVFIVLEQSDNGTKVISKEFAYTDKAFGDCSDWKKSPIRSLLNGEYYNKIAKLIGKNNIIPMERDLTSLDGLDDYGICTDKISLLSASEYSKYHKILGLKPNYTDWWWTITPASTPSNDCSRLVCYIDSYGVLFWRDRGFCGGIRPFLTLNSSMTVTKI